MKSKMSMQLQIILVLIVPGGVAPNSRLIDLSRDCQKIQEHDNHLDSIYYAKVQAQRHDFYKEKSVMATTHC